MKNLQREFITWYFNEFHKSPLYQTMESITEDSPWHREVNVGIHTDMVVGQYLARNMEESWTKDDLIGAFACAFHDVGKPRARTRKYKESRGYYNSFNGHELISARLWEDWAVRNWLRLKEFDFLPFDIYCVGWLIENHLPWGIKNSKKLENLALTVENSFWDEKVFTNVLKADNLGRISDDAEERWVKVNEWCNSFLERCHRLACREVGLDVQVKPDEGQPVMLMPIAPSGAGKSTFVKSQGEVYCGCEPEVYSWDSLRLDWYLTDEERLGVQSQKDAEIAYGYAFQRSIEDNNFNSKAQKAYIELLKADKSVVVDNTNGSRKRRRFFVDQAKKHGYWTIAVLLPITRRAVTERQTTRTDKTVPEEAVMRQYMSLQLPQYGEFDAIVVADTNLPS